jgi:tetratricopeptide (TPR) repeat protein
MEKALEYLERAKKLQPKATSVRSLEVVLLSRTGKEAQAYKQTKELVAAGTYDFDLINAAYVLGARAKDWPMAINALELRSKRWPEQAVDGWLKIGSIYASVAEVKDDSKALAAYKAAMAAAPEANQAPRRARRFRPLTRRASEHRGPSRTRRCDRRWGLPGVRCRPAAGRAVAPSSKRAPGPNPGADRRMPLH